MTEKVNIIGEFNTAMGHIVTVKGDRAFKVGQRIESDGKHYTIKGVNMVYNLELNVVGLIVEKTAS